ncbi:MAG: hypothetical protein AAB286_01025 [Pseudomonadota bacterium]
MRTGHKATSAPLLLFAAVLLLSPALSVASQPDPANYDQCVLAATNKAAGDLAALEAVNSCSEKFQEKGSQDEYLAAEALGKLDADGGFGYGIFSGSIYNGNSNYTVTQVTILLTLIPAGSPLITREYNIDVTVQPLTKGALSVALISDGTREFSWNLTKARGYKAR